MLTNFFQYFQHPTVEAVFLATGNGVFIKSFITTSVFGMWVNSKPCAFNRFFAAAGKHDRKLVLTNFLPFFQFLTVEAKFLSSPLSRLVDTDFELISSRVFLFRCFFSTALKRSLN